MASILELAREVRHRLVVKDTGCLTVDYDGETKSIHFAEGAVTTERAAFLSCFKQDPIDFHFMTSDSLQAGSVGAGLPLLIEAIESIDQASIARVWQRYGDWKITFKLDPEIHNTYIRQHLERKPERLRRLMRLAVSGTLTLEPPPTSIGDDIKRISEAKEEDWRKILGVDDQASEEDIRQTFRKLAARLHPDRWATAGDAAARDGAELAFKRISQAYTELTKARPAAEPPTPAALPKPERALVRGLKKIGRGLRILKYA